MGTICIEREVALAIDELQRLNAFFEFRQQGFSEDDAALFVIKSFPKYRHDGENSDIGRPLPLELRARVGSYEIIALNGWDYFKNIFEEQIEDSSSYNALVRALIAHGWL